MISLQNPGLVPLEAITTMGVSVKETPEAIGFFGTGLKYAIAGLLRSGQKLTIFRGLEKFSFTTETLSVRGKDFQFITMWGPEGNQRLGFTTHLGAHWEMWQIFRELYANMLDEGGKLEEREMKPLSAHTTVLVEGEEFEVAARDRNKFFLTGTPLVKTPYLEVYKGESNGIYYRGLLTNRINAPSAFTYNITTQMELTEDRTLKSDWDMKYYIGLALHEIEDKVILSKILCNIEGFEKDLYFGAVSLEFAETIFDLVERKGTGAVLPRALLEAESYNRREAKVKELPLTPGDVRDLKEATDFLEKLGYPISAEIVVAETLGPGVSGMARHGKIFITRAVLNRAGNYLIGTLLEEHLHLTQGFADESRAFQDFLIDLVVKLAKDGQSL